MNEKSRGERLQLMLTPEELEVLDQFRFQNRMPSRAASSRAIWKPLFSIVHAVL